MMTQTFTSEKNPAHALASLKSAGLNVVCGLIGFLSAFTVPLIGLMPIGELALMLVFPWVIVLTLMHHGWPTRIQQLRWYKLLLVFVGVMAVGYIASDLYRGTSSEDLARGWARVGFLGIDLVAIAYLIDGSWNRLQVFILALYIGKSLNGFLNTPLDDNWWEFGLGPSITALALFLCAGRASVIQIGVALALGAIGMSLGARSLGGVSLLTGVLLGWRRTRGALRALAFLAAVGAIVALLFAANAVILSNLDKTASNRERQSMIETAGEAFIGSPLVGQGSWFTASHITRLEQVRGRLDPTFHGYTEEQARQISIHSQILVALAEGGILGGAFFILYGGLLLKTLRTLTRHSMPHRAFVFYLVIDGLWNLCMSPFSGIARVVIVLTVCACLLVIMQRQGELSDDYRE
jgi:hypothetical protein